MEILNDKLMSQSILDNNGFVYRKCIFKQLQSLIRYMNNNGDSKEDILNKCADLLRAHDTKEVKYTEIINLDNSDVLYNLYDDALKKEYRGDETIYFSRNEMDYVNELKSTRSQRLLFTVMCMLKYQRDIEKKEKRTFITTPFADIMRFSGINGIPSSVRRVLWKDIIVAGKLQIFVTQKGEDVCYRPLYTPKENEEYNIPISTGENFGDQWLVLMRKDVFQCMDCKMWFPKKKQRNNLRCTECNKAHRRKYIAEKVKECRKKKKEDVENGN